MNEFKNNQEANTFNQEAAKAAEPKTVLNGKVVSLQQAKAAEEAFEASGAARSGIQAHHDNSSEPVQAGQVAKSGSAASAAAEQVTHIKKVNVQSGQQHLEQHMSAGAQSEQQQQQQEMAQQVQAAQQAQGAKGTAARSKKGE